MKIKISKRAALIGEIGLCLVPFLYYALSYRRLPPEIPIHFGVDGTADRFIAKSSAEIALLCGLGFLGLILGIALRKAITCATKGQGSAALTEKIMIYSQAALTLLFTALAMGLLVLIATYGHGGAV